MTTRTMAIPLLLVTLLLTSCSPAPKVVYRIPPDKQEAAAKMVEELVRASAGNSYIPVSIMREAMDTAARVYGEPIVVK